MSEDNKKDIHDMHIRLSFEPVYVAQEPIMDVVFIHGLDGDPWETWMAERGDEFWPNWLINKFSNISVYTLGYPANIFAWEENEMDMFERATSVLNTMLTRDIGKRPLVFISHSFGGILTKIMLRKSCDSDDGNWQKINELTRLVVFISTPHTGISLTSVLLSAPQSGVLVTSLLKLVIEPQKLRDKYYWISKIALFFRNPILSLIYKICSKNVKFLEYNPGILRDINSHYRSFANKQKNLRTSVFYETKNTHGLQIVSRDSADPNVSGVEPIPIDKDHILICKPQNKNDIVYEGIENHIIETLEDLKREEKSADGTGDNSGNGKNIKYLRVFISYSHDNVEHKMWVLKLAAKLTANKINVRMDQWHLKKFEVESKFMQDELNDADCILAVCSLNYVQKSEDIQKCIGNDSMILTAELLNSINGNRVIPIIRNSDENNTPLPSFLDPESAIDFSDDNKFDENFGSVLKQLFSKFEEVTLGETDFENIDQSNLNLTSAILNDATMDKATMDKVTLIQATLDKTTLNKATFNDANLTEIDSEATKLSGVKLRGAKLTKADLNNAKLKKTDFTETAIEDSDQEKPNITDVDLLRQNINGKNLNKNYKINDSIKLFINPNIDEISKLTQLSQSNLLKSVEGVMMSYKNSDVFPRWVGFIEEICRILPNLPVISITPTNSIKVEHMIEWAERIAKIPGNNKPGITLPPTKEGFLACKKLTSEGKIVCIGPCENVFQARAAVKENATYIGLFNYVEDYLVNIESLELIREIKGFFEIGSDLKSQILATSISDIDHVRMASSFGADAVSVSIDVLLSYAK